MESILTKLRQLSSRAALVGPEGSGKSTLMEELGNALESEDYRLVRFGLTRESPRFTRSESMRLRENWAPKDFILLDGGELISRLRFWMLKWQTRHAGGLLMTAHQPGLLPTLLNCSTSPALLQNLLSDLMPEEDLSKSVAPLFSRNNGNIREAFRECYLLYAEL